MTMARVLVVEDESGLRSALAAYLESIGYRVEAPAEPADAVAVGERFRPDVVICDWWLDRDIDGVHVARELSSDGNDPALIFITGYSTSELRRQAQGLPVSAVLAKPVSLMELGEEVQRALMA